MKRLPLYIIVASLLFSAATALAAGAPETTLVPDAPNPPSRQMKNPLEITLIPDAGNFTSPQMGDHLKFHSILYNAGGRPLKGLVAWITLLRSDPGHEQPMDLEDWSAHKAVTRTLLKPEESFTVDWPMRLIQAGDYRVMITAVAWGRKSIFTSPFVNFHVRRKPVVESGRILPVALGIPLLIGGLFLWRIRRR